MVDASAASIAGADIVRWTGATGSMDTAAQVDAMLQAHAGTFPGGVLVAAYTLVNGSDVVGIYYDSDAHTLGGASLIAILGNMNSTSTLSGADFGFI
jgi:hypothetical protein